MCSLSTDYYLWVWALNTSCLFMLQHRVTTCKHSIGNIEHGTGIDLQLVPVRCKLLRTHLQGSMKDNLKQNWKSVRKKKVEYFVFCFTTFHNLHSEVTWGHAHTHRSVLFAHRGEWGCVSSSHESRPLSLSPSCLSSSHVFSCHIIVSISLCVTCGCAYIVHKHKMCYVNVLDFYYIQYILCITYVFINSVEDRCTSTE